MTRVRKKGRRKGKGIDNLISISHEVPSNFSVMVAPMVGSVCDSALTNSNYVIGLLFVFYESNT